MGTSIKAQDLSKKYGNHILFDKLSLAIERDEMVAIMGESGSGKTTFINMLGLIEPISSGAILYDEEVISYHDKGKAQNLLRDKIGYLFQNFALLFAQ